MPISGPRAGASNGGGSNAALAAADLARLNGVHDALRERLGRWTPRLAAAGGRVGYARQTADAPTDSPNVVRGSIAPNPPVWTHGADAWRIVAVEQSTVDHAVQIVFGAPSTSRQLRGHGALAFPQADRWVAVPGVVIDRDRETTYVVRVPNRASNGLADLYLRAADLRALPAQAVGGDATAAGVARELGVQGIGAWRAGRTAADQLLLAVSVASQPDVEVLDDGGPSTAEAAALPADVDWEIGGRVYRRADAAASHTARSLVGGRHTESVRTLRWEGVPARALAVGETGLAALGRDVALEGLSIGPAAPAHPGLGNLWIDTSDEDEPALRWWDGLAWAVLIRGGVDYGIALPLNPVGGRLFGLTADQGANLAGLYLSGAGAWTFVGPQPQTSAQSLLLRPSTWARAWIRAADAAAAIAGVANATWTDDGPGTVPTGAHWSLADVPAGADPLWEIVAQVAWQSGAWRFGAWGAHNLDASDAQYSVSGAGGWHSVRAGADRYERHRLANGAWSPAWPLAPEVLAWTRLLTASVRWASVDQGQRFDFAAPVDFGALNDLRLVAQLRTGTYTVLGGIVIAPPPVASYVGRDTGLETPYTWRMRIDTSGNIRWGLSWDAASVPTTYAADTWALEFAAKFNRGNGDGVGVARSMRVIRQNSWNNPWELRIDYR